LARTEVRYQCGHTAIEQLYGPDRERQAKLWDFSQRLCRACWIAKADAAGGGAPIRPQAYRVPGDRMIVVYRAYDCWNRLMARGYTMRTDIDFNPFKIGEARHREDDGESEGFKVWAKRYGPQSEGDAEMAWLASTLNAITEFPAQPKRPSELPTPRAFASADFGRGGLRDKVAVAADIIRKALAREAVHRPYVSFSGGKDSTVLLALVHAVRSDVPVIWSDDELEFPESVAFIESLRYNVQGPFRIVAGHATHAYWFTSWRDAPYWREPLEGTEAIPGLLTDWAQGEGYDLTFLGLRGDESKNRAAFLAEAGPIYHRRGGIVCVPLRDWGDDDIWQFIHATGTPYNAAYDRYQEINLDLPLWRVGPLPLAPRNTLSEGWPEMLARLEARYGPRWS